MNTTEKSQQFVTDPQVFTGNRISWKRLIGIMAAFVAMLVIIAMFYQRTNQGLVTRNALDVAQIARNISEGHGFTTRFIRPFNAQFLEADYPFYKELNHGPVYPYVMATLFKVKGPSDQVAIWTSLLFLVLTIGTTCLIGKKLFDWRTGLLAAAVLSLSPPILRIAGSGEEWTLCAFLFALLLYFVALHHGSTQQSGKAWKAIAYPVIVAFIVTALYMTNHIMVFLLVPLAIYFAVTGPARKFHTVMFLAVALLTMAPWAVRNAQITGFPVLGVTAWDMIAGSRPFPEDMLYRSTDSANHSLAKLLLFPIEHFGAFAAKLSERTADVGSSFASLLGWLAMSFVVVSVLYRFKSPSANALRGLLYGSLPLMIICFALFSVDSSAAVIFAPVAVVLAAAYFLLLLDAKKLHPFFVRCLIAGLLLTTAFPSLVSIVWGGKTNLPKETVVARKAFVNPWFNLPINAGVPVYTDSPWEVAWRTTGVGVWLPRTDMDVINLDMKRLPLNVLAMTPGVDDYPNDEVWFLLHQTSFWKEYIRNPIEAQKQLASFLKTARYPEEIVKGSSKSLDIYSRRFLVTDSIKGFIALPMDPTQPDEFQILVNGKDQ